MSHILPQRRLEPLFKIDIDEGEGGKVSETLGKSTLSVAPRFRDCDVQNRVNFYGKTRERLKTLALCKICFISVHAGFAVQHAQRL